jgi:hypothetical protein
MNGLTYLLKFKSHIRRHQPRTGRLGKVERHHLDNSISQKKNLSASFFPYSEPLMKRKM